MPTTGCGLACRCRGLFVLRRGFTIGQLIDAVLYLDSLCQQDEWKDQVVYLPL